MNRRDTTIQGLCVNGCGRKQGFLYYNAKGVRAYRLLCNRCHKDVKSLKKDHCENPKCTSTIINPCQLDTDHVDGNKANNDPSNIMTLCANCHRLKTYQNEEWRTNYG